MPATEDGPCVDEVSPARPDAFSRQTPHPRAPDPARPGPVWRPRSSYSPSSQSRRSHKEAYVLHRLSAPLPTLSPEVTEGYATSPTSSPNPTPTKSPLIFQSAMDTLRDVYLSQPPTPASSPRKKRPRSDSDNNDNPNSDSDTDMEVDDELPSFTSKPLQPSRLIKPLRKSKSSASKGPDA